MLKNPIVLHNVHVCLGLTMYCSLNFFIYKCIGALNAVDSSEYSLIREEIRLDLDGSNDKADKSTCEDDGDINDFDPFSNSDE